jgi:two-component system sensor histidine kinase UhpB
MPVLHPDAEVAVLRVTQEALSSGARHADAATVNLSLCYVDGLILLAAEDDGRGCGSLADTCSSRVVRAGERVSPRRCRAARPV